MDRKSSQAGMAPGVMSSGLCKNLEGAAPPFQVEPVDDPVDAGHVDEAHHRPGAPSDLHENPLDHLGRPQLPPQVLGKAEEAQQFRQLPLKLSSSFCPSRASSVAQEGASSGSPEYVENTEVPHFKRFPIHLSGTLLPSACLLLRRAVLSGRNRQRRGALWAPPHHGPEKPARQVTLRQQEPAIARVLNQPAAGLHQQLLQAG